MSQERKCVDCVEVKYSHRPVEYVFTFCTITLWAGLAVILSRSPEKLVGYYSFVVLCLTVIYLFFFVRNNIIGRSRIIFLDKDGSLHVHTQGPWDSPTLIEEGGKTYGIVGRDEIAKPFLALSITQTLILQIRLGGWFRSSGRIYFTQDYGWEVVSSWDGNVVLKSGGDQAITIGFSILNPSNETAHLLQELQENYSTTMLVIGLRYGKENRIFLEKLIGFVIGKIRDSKDTLGNSKHAQALREFFEDVNERALPYDPRIGNHHLFNIPFPGFEKTWDAIMAKHQKKQAAEEKVDAQT